tara:strand:- start:430 stop:615 length:186 start_codon:yes stop_codon:yes gene_type:complete
MEDRTYLSIAYMGMIIGIGIWTWTIVSRSRRLASRITAMEQTLNVKYDESESTITLNDNDE